MDEIYQMGRHLGSGDSHTNGLDRFHIFWQINYSPDEYYTLQRIHQSRSQYLRDRAIHLLLDQWILEFQFHFYRCFVCSNRIGKINIKNCLHSLNIDYIYS